MVRKPILSGKAKTMSDLNKDAAQARINAMSACDAVQDLRRDMLQRFDGLDHDLHNMPKDLALRESVKALSRDMHTTSSRPCSTCQAVSAALGESFGCVVYAIRIGAKRP